MSAEEKLELDFRVCLRCTVDTRDKSERHIYSSEFPFKGQGCQLNYVCNHNPDPECDEWQYNLNLWRCSGVSSSPFRVSVQVESSATGRIVGDLIRETLITLITSPFEWEHCFTWWSTEEEIVRSLPEFRRSGILKFLVVLKTVGSDSSASETECCVPEAAGPSGRSRSISVQTILLGNAIPCLENLSRDLAQLIVEDSQHDMEFLCSGQSIKAHKLIVCRRSPVIASMMSRDMVEGRTGLVKIPDIEPDVFRHLLGYIYSGRTPDLTVDLAISLYESGDQYGVLGLTRRCAEYLVEHLSAENACRLLIVADAHSGEDFRESVIVFMLDNDIPMSGGDWQDFCHSHSKLAIEVLNRYCLKLRQR